jgi:AraC-like DNA-binding protein
VHYTHFILYINVYSKSLSLQIPEEPENPYNKEIIKSLIQGGLLALCGMLSIETEQQQASSNTQGNDIFSRFIDLLQNSKTKRMQVSKYASMLCISPKYLTMVCKQHSGKTALQWIEEYTIADIDYYICNTDKSMKEICNILGFPNASFFGKYVREHLGMTPLEYRNKHNK